MLFFNKSPFTQGRMPNKLFNTIWVFSRHFLKNKWNATTTSRKTLAAFVVRGTIGGDQNETTLWRVLFPYTLKPSKYALFHSDT